MFNKQFWKAAAERAAKTFAQALAAALLALPAASALGLDVLSVDWQTALSLAGGATLLSLLSSVGSSMRGDSTSPSLLERGNS